MGKVSVQDFVEALDSWTVLELNEAVKKLEEKYGVTAAVAAPVAAAPGAPAAAAAAAEKTEFTVVLAGIGEKKIQVIKEIRAITGLGLKEAKDLVDGAPKTLKEKISKTEAADMRAKLEEQGATVEIK